MTAHGVDLGYQGDFQLGVGLGDGNGRAQSGAACADDYYISLYRFHGFSRQNL
jgi:hypothetical protein